jgi:hypothetical protein
MNELETKICRRGSYVSHHLCASEITPLLIMLLLNYYLEILEQSEPRHG